MANLANNSGVKAPCLGCMDRHVGCHSECGKYKEYKDKNDQINKEIRESKVVSKVLYTYNKQKEKGINSNKLRKKSKTQI